MLLLVTLIGFFYCMLELIITYKELQDKKGNGFDVKLVEKKKKIIYQYKNGKIYCSRHLQKWYVP